MFSKAMNDMRLCIFCETELTDQTKPEHILLSALGGRKTTRWAICSQHNNDFGATIDKALAEMIGTFRNLLQLESGTGKPAPSIQTENEAGERLKLRSDGTPELIEKPFEVTPRDQGGFDIQINARSEADVRRAVPHIAAQTGISEDDVWGQLADGGSGARVRRSAGVIPRQLQLGGEVSLRAMCKAALCLMATSVGTDPLRSDAFSEVRAFVQNGGDKFNRILGSLDPRRLPSAEVVEAKFGPLFNLLIVRSDEAGRVVAHFTLYNLVAWQMVLAEAGGPPDTYLALVSNPLKPSSWSDQFASEIDVPFTWLNAPDSSDLYARSTERMNAALKVWHERSQSQLIGDIVQRAFDAEGPADGSPLSPDAAARIRARLAEEVTHHVLGLSLKQSLSAEEIAAMRAMPSNPKKN